MACRRKKINKKYNMPGCSCWGKEKIREFNIKQKLICQFFLSDLFSAPRWDRQSQNIVSVPLLSILKVPLIFENVSIILSSEETFEESFRSRSSAKFASCSICLTHWHLSAKFTSASPEIQFKMSHHMYHKLDGFTLQCLLYFK